MPSNPANCLDLFYAIANGSNSSVIVTDVTLPDHPIVYANPSFEKMTGYASGEVVGQNCRFLQGQDRDQPDRAVIRAALDQGTACECLLRNYRKNGELFWNKLYMFPVRLEQETVSHFVGVQHDVTRERTLLAALQDTAADRARLSLDLINAQEMERKGLALELHDELGQRLTVLNLLLHRALPLFEAGRAQALWDQFDRELASLVALVRNLAVSLRPPGLDYFGLEPTVRELLSRQFGDMPVGDMPVGDMPVGDMPVGDMPGVATPGVATPGWVFEYAGLPARLPPAIEISVFRIVQESVTNIVRHARARHVVVEINGGADGAELELIVRDDGVGFDGAAWRGKTIRAMGAPRAGLAGIHERVRLLGGTFDVDSAPGRGTRVTATIPLGTAAGPPAPL